MRGKRFVVFQEPENDDQINVGKMKEYSGGDWIYARPLYREPFKFKPQFKMLLTCNKLPRIPSDDGGTWRRLRVSPWESEFVDLDEDGLFDGKELKDNQFPKDFDLGDKFEKWKQAFMYMLITKYYKIFKKKGIREPEKVSMYTKEYRKNSDIYGEFLDDQVIKTKNTRDYEELSFLYELFKGWYKDSQPGGKCPSKKELKKYMENNGYKCDKRYVRGIKINCGDDGNEINDELDG